MTAQVAKNSRRGSKPGQRRGGRQKGTPNKVTASVKDAFLAAHQGIGGVSALTTWAGANQTEFYKLLARLIPTEVTAPDGHVLGVVVLPAVKE